MEKVVELFSGTESFSKEARAMGMQTFTSDSNKRFKSDYCVNILNFDPSRVPFRPDIFWISPPCTYYSVASMWKHWNKDYTPKTLYAMFAKDLVLKALELINILNPEALVYFENPRGMLRHLGLLDHLKRHTVTYCQYGETRMKPTDIWTNDDLWSPRAACESSDKCHTSRTDDLTTSTLQAVVPRELCIEILQSARNNLSEKARAR